MAGAAVAAEGASCGGKLGGECGGLGSLSGLGPGAFVGMMRCQDGAGQAGFAHEVGIYVGWIWSVPGSSPCLHFLSFVSTRGSGFFPSHFHLGHLSPVFAVGLKLAGPWADWYKSVPVWGGRVADLAPSGLFRASFPQLLQHLNAFPELYVVLEARI